MAEGIENAGVQREAPPPRPLWVAALAAALTAVLAALLGIMVVDADYNSRIPIFCDGCIRIPNPFTFQWWAYIAPFFPYIAFVAVVYALSLLAIVVFLERRPNGRRLPWPVAGVLATAPLAGIWIVVMIARDLTPPLSSALTLVVWLTVMGLIGGTVAGVVRRDQRA